MAENHILTIASDDPAPQLSFAAAANAELENAGTVNVLVKLDAVSELPVSLPFALSGSTISPADYTTSPTPFTTLIWSWKSST